MTGFFLIFRPPPHAYFCAGVYTLPETGNQPHTCFDMTRDGFTLLAMGFTGKKALAFKLKYIEQFNRMEEELKQREVRRSSRNQLRTCRWPWLPLPKKTVCRHHH